MGSKKINQYRVLTSQLSDEIDLSPSQVILSLNSNYSDNEFELELTNNDISEPSFSISDKSNTWRAGKQDLYIFQKWIIGNSRFLFGIDGVAEANDVIGIAVKIWSSTSSNQEIVKLGSIGNEQKENVEIILNYQIVAGQFWGTVNFDLFLYLKEKGSSLNSGFAVIPGTVLGHLNHFSLILDGVGSVFPIMEFSDADAPLWLVEKQWEDIHEDPFSSDFVSININRKHPAYKDLFKETIVSKQLLSEIISSALSQIVQMVIKDDPEIRNIDANQLTSGSIAQAVKYLIQTYDISEQPEKVDYTVRLAIEKIIGGKSK